MTPEHTSSIPASKPAPVTPTARRVAVDSRYVAPIFITIILLVSELSFRILEDFRKTLLSIVASILTEIVLSRLVYKKWPHLASAYVSGISVGILIRSPFFWPYALCAVISIASKYVLRVKGRHLWNPSNFGIAAMLFLAPAAVASLSIQWGNTIAPMVVVWLLGSVILWRLRRFHICATYAVSFLLFALLRSMLTHQPLAAEVAPITGPMYQLFIFFMITDPKSTVLTFRGQVLVAFCVAAAECVLRLRGDVHAPYNALFLVGPAANLIEIWRNSRPKRTSAGADSA